ncbi:hypothetical protein JCM6882_005522 [Rhodosporidiobolus microsporus]
MAPSSNSTPELNALLALGIEKQKALYALGEHGGEVEAAADWCFTEGASWTPQSLLSTTFSPPPTAQEPPTSALFSHDRSHPDHPPGWRPTPHRLLVAGTKVAITLKEDQGTGRTVEGVVRERLTKGDHPRGVKIRLEDGRVGRVVRVLQ